MRLSSMTLKGAARNHPNAEDLTHTVVGQGVQQGLSEVHGPLAVVAESDPTAVVYPAPVPGRRRVVSKWATNEGVIVSSLARSVHADSPIRLLIAVALMGIALAAVGGMEHDGAARARTRTLFVGGEFRQAIGHITRPRRASNGASSTTSSRTRVSPYSSAICARSISTR